MRSFFLLTLFVILSCTSPTAHTSVATPTATALRIEPHRSTVLPGKFVELNLKLPASLQPVAIEFRANAPLEWNIHSHPNGKVLIHASGSGESDVIKFVPPTAGGFSWLWENKGPVAVEVFIIPTLPNGAEIDSWI